VTTAVAEDRGARGSSAIGDGWLTGLAAITALAAALELILLRVATRTLIHIPGVERAEGPFTLIAEIGRLAFSVSEVLLIMLLGGMGLWGARAGWTVEATAVAVFGLTAVAARMELIDPLAVVAASTVAVVVLGVSTVRNHPAFAGRRAAWVPLLLIGVAIILFGVRAVSVGVTAAGVDAAGPWQLGLAEGVALAGLVLLPLATGRPDRIAAVGGLVVGVSMWLGLSVADSTVKILFLWNLGLAGSLPALAYATAGGAATMATLTAARSGRADLVIAIVLLVAGGFAIQSTYQSGLLVAAFGVLAIVVQSARRPRRATQPPPASTTRRGSPPLRHAYSAQDSPHHDPGK